MAGPDRQTPDPLIAELAEKPFSFDFFAALRALQSRHRDRPRIGCSLSPAQDPVRFAQNPALDFAPSTIEAVDQRGDDRPPVLYARHFGLFGPNGPLPLCLTEYARDRILHHRDRTFAAFCNVFHHRLASFFFRAWADARKTVDLDRPEESRWGCFVGSLVGLGMESSRRRDSLPDAARLYYAGRLAQQTRNAEGLEAIIQEFFGVPAEVHTFVGRWIDLPPGCECKLGASRSTGSLGVNAIAGSRVWHGQYAFRIRLGPLHLADFERLLPQHQAFRRLCDWVRFYTNGQYAWDVQLVLARDEVPSVQLGRSGRLGWQSWLRTRPFEHDAEDLILQPEAVPA
jgi:type VI secretion system protein ImpH